MEERVSMREEEVPLSPARVRREGESVVAGERQMERMGEGIWMLMGGIKKEETMGRPSNKSGWLQTLRSCMRTLMIPRKLPP